MQSRIEHVDCVLERLDLRRRDAQHRPRPFVRLPWNAKVGAEVEQIVLDARQHRLDREIGRIAESRTARIARPIAQFVSSTSPIAATRASLFDRRDPSPSPVSPLSPVRV